jgi:hypothetical protein
MTTALIPSATAKAAAKPIATDALSRAQFNELAFALATPLFWVRDANNNATLDPEELATFRGLAMKQEDAAIGSYVASGQFTSRFYEVYGEIQKAAATPPTGVALRLRKELSQGRQTLVQTDLSTLSPDEKVAIGKILDAAALVEELYQAQMGVFGTELGASTEARSVFFRNQSPKCEAPQTQSDADCYAGKTPGAPASGLYPAAMQKVPDFCKALAKAPANIMDPFTRVGGTDAAPSAEPYTSVYGDRMKKVSSLLKEAATALSSVPQEAAFRTYLLAAAQAFLDNQWWPADEAWAKMGVDNSKFYLRIAPDEVYSEPCSTKALFHVSFGLINQGSKKLQAKLDPLKQAMEQELAKLAGAPYKERKVTFKLPDFMDVALNAGDSRSPSGATIGQSLPNFGPVANEGRGRTVAMINFYTDEDSRAAQRATASALFCKDTAALFPTEPEPQLLSTVLHEAAHNLGPAHQYKVNGKVDREVFGGPLASTLEELKAQTAAMHFLEWMVGRKEMSRQEADRAHIADIFWAFGHISRGMYDDAGHPKNYSQLAAIQFGSFVDAGAIIFRSDAKAANGTDSGCYEVVLDKLQKAVPKLMKEVAQVKGKGDKAKADAMMKAFVDVQGARKEHLDRIRERVLRAPKASFVYSIKL